MARRKKVATIFGVKIDTGFGDFNNQSFGLSLDNPLGADDRTATKTKRSKRDRLLHRRARQIQAGQAEPITPQEQQNFQRRRDFLGRPT